jgi:hypothetical protein
MSTTPIFDELYAKYVTGAPVGTKANSHAATAPPALRERHDRAAVEHTPRHTATPAWPS